MLRTMREVKDVNKLIKNVDLRFDTYIKSINS